MGKTSEIYDLLLNVKNGYDPGWTRFGVYDDLLSDINFNKSYPGLSIVTIVFDNYSQYLNLFEDLSDYDVNIILSYIHNPVRWFNETQDYDWTDGYVYNSLNEENKEKMEKIFTFITKKNNLDIKDKLEEFMSEFENESYSICDEWLSEENECKMKQAKQELYDEFSNKFHFVGIRELSEWYSYKTNVNILLKLFNLFNLEGGTLTELLKEIIKKFDKTSHDGYYDEIFSSSGCENFDYESFNRNASYYIDKVLDIVMESEGYVDVEKYFEIKNEIINKYGFNKWIPLRGDKSGISFMIDDVDPENNKIIITLRNRNSNNLEQRRSLTFNELKRMETQYELFNENKKIKKKFF